VAKKAVSKSNPARARREAKSTSSDKATPPAWTLFPPTPPPWLGPGALTLREREQERARYDLDLQAWKRDRQLWQLLERKQEQERRAQGPKELPLTRPANISRMVWMTAQTVFALKREGAAWVSIEKHLLLLVRKRLDSGDSVSLPTLKRALAWLRENGFGAF
jgi:hypothetical protein